MKALPTAGERGRYAVSVADFLRFLPLSGRARQDEGEVSSDRRRELDTLVGSLAALSRAESVWVAFATDAGLAGLWRRSGGTVEGFRAALLEQRRSIRVLSRALAAALQVVAGHTIRATDADWAFGNGPVLEGTSLQIVGFLLGVTDDPPRPPHQPSSPAEPAATPE